MAMEFAITAPVNNSGADDSWQPGGSGSFFVSEPQAVCALAVASCGSELHLRLALIAIFGAIGTLARYGLQGLVQVRTASTFPYGTLLVNLSGCFLLGLIGQFTLNRMVISPDWRVAIAVGFFGGYTTFSC